MIKNEPTIHEEHIDDLRAAIEHRATWFALLIQHAEKRGLDLEFARDAIYECGCIHGDIRFPQTEDLAVFAGAFGTENVKKIFEMETEVSPEAYNITFHYCPLVAAWKKLGIAEDKIAALCDAAMNGDRGIISRYPPFSFHLGDTIAGGKPTCQVRITKNAGL